MKNDTDRGETIRTKNWILFGLLLGFMLLLYGLSFVKFGETVAQAAS